MCLLASKFSRFEASTSLDLRTYAGTLDIAVEQLRLSNRKKPNNCDSLSFEVEIERQVSFTLARLLPILAQLSDELHSDKFG